MKRRQAALAAVLVLTVACTANKATYVALGVTVHTVDVGMKLWAQQVVAGQTKPEQEAKVRDAYKKYQDTAHTLQVALEVTNTTPTPPQLAIVADSLIALIQEFTGKKVTP